MNTINRHLNSIQSRASSRRPKRAPRDATRRGSVILEVVIALIICGVVITVIAQLVTMVARQRELAARQHLASQEAANVMERISAFSWDKLTQENADAIDTSGGFQSRVPGAELSVQVSDAGETQARKIQVDVKWTGPSGNAGRTARLVAWRYPGQEQRP